MARSGTTRSGRRFLGRTDAGQRERTRSRQWSVDHYSFAAAPPDDGGEGWARLDSCLLGLGVDLPLGLYDDRGSEEDLVGFSVDLPVHLDRVPEVSAVGATLFCRLVSRSAALMT